MRLGIVVPCYNEEAVVRDTADRLSATLESLAATGAIARDSYVCFVDDGSEDGTWSLVESMNAGDPRIRGIKLSRHRGHQNALLAGLFTAEGDALITIDADLQDDLAVVDDMVTAFADGYEIVYGVKRRRDPDSLFKRVTARWYYRLLEWMGAETIPNHADFRLMGRTAVESLKQFPEVNLFLRGLVPLIGFKSRVIFYDRRERRAGESKYPLRRMLAFAMDGITSFSTAPLRAITILGIVVCVASLGLGVDPIGVKLWNDEAVPGWASTVVPVYFLGGIQLLSIGVIGEYVAKTYLEVKRRPRYFIEKVL